MIALFARRCFAWPLVTVGYGLTLFAGLMIRAGAWIMDVETGDA